MSYHAIEERLLSYDEIEPTPSRPSFSTRAFELLDDACKLAFGILCVESLGYLGYLYFTGAEADPLLSFIKPMFKNILCLPGMLLVAVGGVMGFRR